MPCALRTEDRHRPCELPFTVQTYRCHGSPLAAPLSQTAGQGVVAGLVCSMYPRWVRCACSHGMVACQISFTFKGGGITCTYVLEGDAGLLLCQGPCLPAAFPATHACSAFPRHSHPWTLLLACPLSRHCAVAQALVLTAIVVLSLTAYTFHAGRRDRTSGWCDTHLVPRNTKKCFHVLPLAFRFIPAPLLRQLQAVCRSFCFPLPDS